MKYFHLFANLPKKTIKREMTISMHLISTLIVIILFTKANADEVEIGNCKFQVPDKAFAETLNKQAAKEDND